LLTETQHHIIDYGQCDDEKTAFTPHRFRNLKRAMMEVINSILSGVDWNDVLKTIGSTTVVVAILGFLAQATIKHFLKRLFMAKPIVDYSSRIEKRA
jgi:hypothetical protein